MGSIYAYRHSYCDLKVYTQIENIFITQTINYKGQPLELKALYCEAHGYKHYSIGYVMMLSLVRTEDAYRSLTNSLVKRRIAEYRLIEYTAGENLICDNNVMLTK